MQTLGPTTRGFTIAEMVMALAIGSVIAMAAGGVAMGLSYSCQHQDDYRQSVQSATAVVREVRTLVHKAQLITGAWGDRVGIWIDADGSQTVQQSEMTMIYYDSANRQVLESKVVFPSTWTLWQILNAQSLLSMTVVKDASALLAALTSDSHVQTTVLAEDVWAFSVTGTQANTNNNRIEVSVTAGTGARRFTLRSAVTLRASLIGKV